MERLKNCTFIMVDENGEAYPAGLVYKNTNFPNYKYIVTDDIYSALVGVAENNNIYLVGDRVKVTDDCYGYISYGISSPGMGIISEIQYDDTDYFYGVLMDNGEFDYLKSSRISVITH